MHLSRLSLHNFRSYDYVELDLEPGVTTMIGLNGQGKTNLVEAVHYLAHLSSHRVARDLPLVRAGQSQAVIAAKVAWADRSQSIELEINASGPNRARVAGAPRRPRDARGIVRAVIFAPEDMSLVKGDPGVRRRFLDDLLVAVTPRYAGLLSDYERVVKQRSALLKSLVGSRRYDDSVESTLEVWNEQLVALGSELTWARLRLLDSLRQPLSEAYSTVAPGAGDLVATYESAWLQETAAASDRTAVAAQLAQAIEDHRRVELARGLTVVGPQRDDVLLTLAGLPAKGYASHGEAWSVALALRLATFSLQRESFDTGGDPILILDDVFAELDTQRRDRLATVASEVAQVLVTAAVTADVPTGLRGRTLTVERTGAGLSQVTW